MNKVQGKGGIDFDAIKKTCALLLAIYAMSTAFSYIQGWLMSGVSNKMGYQLRKEMNQRLINFHYLTLIKIVMETFYLALPMM